MELGRFSGFQAEGPQIELGVLLYRKSMELGRFSGFPGSGSTNRVRDDFVKEINGVRKVF